MKKHCLALTSTLVLLVIAVHARAYDLLYPVSVKDNSHEWKVHLPGIANNGLTFLQMFQAGSEEWMSVFPGIRLSVVAEEHEHCSGPYNTFNGVNTVAFVETDCDGGDPPAGGWASNLARFDIQDGRVVWHDGPPRIVEGDISIANFQEHPWETDPEQYFRLVKHEMGHNLGLGHSLVIGATMRQGGYDYDITWFDQLSPDDICGLAVVTAQRALCPISLGPTVSTSDLGARAHFSGYASSNGGITAKEVFRPWEEVNVYGTVAIDLVHYQEAGAIHVVGRAPDGTLYARDDAGNWALFQDGEFPPPALVVDQFKFSRDIVVLGRNGEFQEGAEYDWVNGLFLYPSSVTGERYGLEGLVVEFFIAYSVVSQPGHLVYGSEPIRVEWTQE